MPELLEIHQNTAFLKIKKKNRKIKEEETAKRKDKACSKRILLSRHEIQVKSNVLFLSQRVISVFLHQLPPPLSFYPQLALSRLRDSLVIDDELAAIRLESEAEKAAPKVRFASLFTSAVLRQPLALSIVLHLSQQLCGINGVFYYSKGVSGGEGCTLGQKQVVLRHQ